MRKFLPKTLAIVALIGMVAITIGYVVALNGSELNQLEPNEHAATILPDSAEVEVLIISPEQTENVQDETKRVADDENNELSAAQELLLLRQNFAPAWLWIVGGLVPIILALSIYYRRPEE